MYIFIHIRIRIHKCIRIRIYVYVYVYVYVYMYTYTYTYELMCVPARRRTPPFCSPRAPRAAARPTRGPRTAPTRCAPPHVAAPRTTPCALSTSLIMSAPARDIAGPMPCDQCGVARPMRGAACAAVAHHERPPALKQQANPACCHMPRARHRIWPSPSLATSAPARDPAGLTSPAHAVSISWI